MGDYLRLIYAINDSPVAEHNFPDHLVEPVGNAVTIMLSDLLRREVGGDKGEKLLFVTLCQQVNDWSTDVAIVHYLYWLYAKVIDDEHINIEEVTVCLIVILAEIRNGLYALNPDSAGHASSHLSTLLSSHPSNFNQDAIPALKALKAGEDATFCHFRPPITQ